MSGNREVETRKIIDAPIESWYESRIKFQVRPVSQDRILVDGKVVEFITHYEVVN